MNESYSDKIKRKRAEAAAKKQREQDLKQSAGVVKGSTDALTHEIARQGAKSRTSTQKVKVENTDLAKSGDVQGAVDAINKLNLTTFVATQNSYNDMVEQMGELCSELTGLASRIEGNGQSLDKTLTNSIKKISEVTEKLAKVNLTTNDDIKKALADVSKAIQAIDVRPEVKVDAPIVNVPENKLDLSPLVSLLQDIDKSVQNIPQPEEKEIHIDLNSVTDSLQKVEKAVSGLRFPIPNYVLPYRDSSSKATQALVDADGHVQVDVLTAPAVSIDTTGLATTAKQDAQTALLTTIDADTSVLAVTDFATEAKQDAMITAIEAIPGGGGVQYTEGDTDTTITGTAVLWEDASNTLRVPSSAKPFPVEIIAGAGSGGTAAADDADFTAGTTSGTPAMGVYESTPTSVTDGDLGTVGITQGRRLKTSATIDAALPAGTNNIGDVDVLSSALPTGASTSAKQDTIIGHLDGVEGLLTTIDGDTGNISTKIDTLAGAVTGTEMQVDVLTMPSVAVTNAGLTELAAAIDTELQVDVVGALPAGTNAIGKLAANSGVDIGDVDVTTVTPGTGASNLGKAEDAAHTTADVGVFALGVRNDTMADTTNTDADYSQISTDLKGRVITTNAPRARKLHQITTITSSTSETTVLTAAASTFHDVYGIIVTNTSATATEVHFKDDTAGTTRFTLSAPANDTRGFMLPIDAAIPASATNDNWTATCVDSVASIIITVLAVKNL